MAQTGKKELTEEERRVLFDGATERPYSGKYLTFDEAGTYCCKVCGSPLFRSSDKFNAGCGWPSFDDEIEGAVKKLPDKDGIRTEIRCARCGAHLGHIFTGERFTAKNRRYCVNSLSMEFEPAEVKPAEEIAYFAGGCFWGVEHMLQKIDGVKTVESGFMGGTVKNPSYREVCTKTTGHAEVVKVTFDPARTDYETIARTFFEIHDPTQADGQGPDIGPQYRSEIFYTSPQQRETADRLIGILKNKGYKVVTKVTPATEFYPAEEYHQDYYDKKGTEPYCHSYTKRF